MSAVSESIAQRVTLGILAERYGFEIDPQFAANVTVTSISDTTDTVIPGSLFICDGRIADLAHAAQSGAYAALVPRKLKGQCPEVGIPLMYGEIDDHTLGSLANGLAGDPSNAMAVFALTGTDDGVIDADVAQLAEFLHMLGNPVAVISATGSTSMTRTLNLTYPLGILDMQRVLSVCAEDGVAAVVIAMNEATLRHHALEFVNVDVLGAEHADLGEDLRTVKSRYSFVADQALAITTTTGESDAMAADAPAMFDIMRLGHMSLAISMVLAAGVRRNNVINALRVANNLN
jgi:hypothetical protein